MIKTVAKDEMDLLKGDIKVDLPRRRARQGVK
jgi:hypothetical protein